MNIPKKQLDTPPDEIWKLPVHKTKKIPLKHIVRNVSTLLKINEIVDKANRCRLHVTLFLRLYLLKHRSVIVNRELITNCFSVIDPKTIGRQKSVNMQAKFNDLLVFYNTYYKPLLPDNYKIDTTNLNVISSYITTEIMTSYSVTIINKYCQHLFRYINCLFKYVFKDICDSYENQEDNDVCFDIVSQETKIISYIICDNFETKQQLRSQIKENYLKLTDWINYITKDYQITNKIFVVASCLRIVRSYTITYEMKKTLTRADIDWAIINGISCATKMGRSHNKTQLSSIKNKMNYMRRKDLKDIKIHLLSNEGKYKPNFGFYVHHVKNNILPKIPDEIKHNDYVLTNPLHYFQSLLKMTEEMEVMCGKKFQCMPLSDDFTHNYIKIDSKSLVENFDVTRDIGPFTKNGKTYRVKTNYLDKIEETQPELWGHYFLTNKSEIRKMGKNYVFDYSISTDGYGASIMYLRKDRVGKYNPSKSQAKFELPYLDNGNRSALELLQIRSNPNIAFDDPGKKDLHYMIGRDWYDEKGNKDSDRLRYSIHQRIRETGRDKKQKFVERFKISNNHQGVSLLKLEEDLSNYDGKTINVDKFKAYIKKRVEMYEKLNTIYNNGQLKKWKMRSYINQQRSETKFVSLIKEKFQIDPNKRINIIIGNWNESEQMRNFVPTPGIGLIRRIEKYGIKFYKVNEAYTSCIDHITGKRLENKVVEIDKKSVKLHMVLVRKQKRRGNIMEEHINRNYMGAHGIRMVAEQYLKDKTRPKKYTHTVQKKKTTDKLIVFNSMTKREQQSAAVSLLDKTVIRLARAFLQQVDDNLDNKIIDRTNIVGS